MGSGARVGAVKLIKQKSIRELDSLSDRIKLHRQRDPRGILVVEGPSDERFIERLAPRRWAVFPAGTRNVVISTIEDVIRLHVDRVAGLVDRDFDDVVLSASGRGVPIFWYETADLEGHLVLTEAFDHLLHELASKQKLASYGGVPAVREKAISTAIEVAVLRAANCTNGWCLPFDGVDLSKKIDRDTLSLKRLSFCQALTQPDHIDVHHDTLGQFLDAGLQQSNSGSGDEMLFSGKDVLVIVGVALKGKIGTCDGDVTKSDHLSRVLRLTAAVQIMDLPPLSEIRRMIDIADSSTSLQVG